jgi:hypothetical protein
MEVTTLGRRRRRRLSHLVVFTDYMERLWRSHPWLNGVVADAEGAKVEAPHALY